MEGSNDELLPEVDTLDVVEFSDRNELVKSLNTTVVVDEVAMADERKTEVENRGERERESDFPPEDDCSLICFGNCNYAAVSRPCKCTMCVRHITNLSPEASLHQCQEHEVKEVLARVHRYNRLFVGGLTGFVQMLMGTLYTAAEFNFIPTGGFRIMTLFAFLAIAMIVILCLVGIHRRRH